MQSPSKEKILMICPNLPPVICGVGDYVTFFSQELIRQKPEVEISFLVRQPDFTKVATQPLTAEKTYQSPFKVYAVAPFHWKIYHLLDLFKTVRESQANTIHLHYVPHGYYRAGFGIAVSIFGWWLRLAGFKLVVTFHELYIPWKPKLKWTINAIFQRLSFLLLLLASHEAVVTTKLRQKAISRWLFWNRAKANRLIVVPVGSNFPTPENYPVNKKELRKKWGIKEDELVIGRLGGKPLKAQLDCLLETLEAVGHIRPDTRLLLIGTSKEHLISNHPLSEKAEVIYTGYCTPSEGSELLSCCDIFLLPLEDGVATRRTSLMAGIQHGLPIVSNIGFNTDKSLVETLPAILCTNDDPVQFAQQTCKLVLSPEKRFLLGNEAAQYYKANYTWERIVERHLPLLLVEPKKGE